MLDSLRTIIRPARKQSIFRTDRGGASGVGRVFAGLVVCLVVAGLLSSGRLVSMAERQEFGSRRDRWIAAAETVDALAGMLQLDRPAGAIEAALGQNDDEPIDVVLGELTPIATVSETTSTPSPETAIDESAAQTPDTLAIEPAPTTTTAAPPTTTTSAAPTLGEASANDPLRIWVGGDSLGEYIGSQLLNKVADRDLTEIELDFSISTGLARPDYFDWPARLSEIMQRGDRPQVVVFMVGGNDDQDVMVDGRRGVIGTDEWRTAYQQRVATMMDIAAYDGVQMLWINLPPMRDESRQAIAGDINAALEAEAGSRPWVDVVDIVDLFTGPGGGYDQFIDEPGGAATRKARASDGVHITRSASEWVADLVWQSVSDRWSFDYLTPPTAPPPSSTTVPTETNQPATTAGS